MFGFICTIIFLFVTGYCVKEGIWDPKRTRFEWYLCYINPWLPLISSISGKLISM